MSKPATRAVPAVGGSSVVSISTVVDLPGAVGAEEAVDLARLDPQVDPVHRARPFLELAHEADGFDARPAAVPTELPASIVPPLLG